MYTIHKVILFIAVLAAWIGSCALKLDFTPVASSGVDFISICTAVYLAIYPAIQGNAKLVEKLRKQDDVRRDKSEIGVLNAYIIVGLIIGFISIIAFCSVLVVNDRGGTITELLTKQRTVPFWRYALSSTCYALFAGDLVQIFWIGRFIVNRVAFDS